MLRELTTQELKSIVAVSKQAEAGSKGVTVIKFSLLDDFFATVPTQEWFALKLATLWRQFPIVAFVTVIAITIFY